MISLALLSALVATITTAPSESPLNLPALLGQTSEAIYRTLRRCEVMTGTPLRLACQLPASAPAPSALIDFDDAMVVKGIELRPPAYRTLGAARQTTAALLTLMGASDQERRQQQQQQPGRPAGQGHRFVVSRAHFVGTVMLRPTSGGWTVAGKMNDPTFRARAIPAR